MGLRKSDFTALPPVSLLVCYIANSLFNEFPPSVLTRIFYQAVNKGEGGGGGTKCKTGKERGGGEGEGEERRREQNARVTSQFQRGKGRRSEERKNQFEFLVGERYGISHECF